MKKFGWIAGLILVLVLGIFFLVEILFCIR